MSVTAARGFRAAGVTAGLKPSGRPDVALVVNDGPLTVAAGVFTTNRIVAAPVVWSRQAVADGVATAVVLNSGGANACTGPDGFADTHRTAEHVARLLDASPGDVLVCSTGLIGQRLDLSALLAGTEAAARALSPAGGADAAEAIRTTDTVAKTVVVARDGWTAFQQRHRQQQQKPNSEPEGADGEGINRAHQITSGADRGAAQATR